MKLVERLGRILSFALTGALVSGISFAAVTNWSTTSSLNVESTGVSGTGGGVSIDEGMAPSAVNNGMRDFMSQIATWRTTGAIGAFFGQTVIGHTAALSFGSLSSNFQVVGSSAATGQAAIAMFNATGSTAPRLDFYKSANASIGSATVVASGDRLGLINFLGAQQTGTFATQTGAAQIRVEVDGTVTSGAGPDMPGRMIFYTTPDGSGTATERLRIDSAGLATFANNVTVTGTLTGSALVDISGASAGQIQFPASQNASAGANVLDDYEEGTWTPTFTVGGSGSGVTYTTQTGRYTKTGRKVCIEGELLLSNNGSNTGAAAIGSLPFTVGTTTAASIVGYSGFSGITAGIQGVFTTGTATIEVRAPSTTGTTSVDETQATNTARFFLGGCYSV